MFASWLVMEGVPLFEVSKLLRHASIQMTERDVHLPPEGTRTLVQILEGNAGESSTLSSTWTMEKTVELPEPVTASENGRGERI